jgi:hypothetical protein
MRLLCASQCSLCQHVTAGIMMITPSRMIRWYAERHGDSLTAFAPGLRVGASCAEFLAKCALNLYSQRTTCAKLRLHCQWQRVGADRHGDAVTVIQWRQLQAKPGQGRVGIACLHELRGLRRAVQYNYTMEARLESHKKGILPLPVPALAPGLGTVTSCAVFLATGKCALNL